MTIIGTPQLFRVTSVVLWDARPPCLNARLDEGDKTVLRDTVSLSSVANTDILGVLVVLYLERGLNSGPSLAYGYSTVGDDDPDFGRR